MIEENCIATLILKTMMVEQDIHKAPRLHFQVLLLKKWETSIWRFKIFSTSNKNLGLHLALKRLGPGYQNSFLRFKIRSSSKLYQNREKGKRVQSEVEVREMKNMSKFKYYRHPAKRKEAYVRKKAFIQERRHALSKISQI